MAHLNYWEDNGLYRVFYERITGDEILRSNLSLHGDPRFDDIRYVLNDFTGIEDFEINERDVHVVAAIDDAAAMSKPVLKIAIVASHELLLNWIYKYCDHMKNSPFECKVFETLEDSREWASR